MKKHRSMWEKGNRRFATAMVLPAGLTLVLLIVFPVVLTVYNSTFDINTLTRETKFVGIANFVQLLTAGRFWAATWRTTIWVACSLIGQVSLALVISSLLQLRVPGRNLVRGIVLFPYMLPAVVAAAIWRFLLNDLLGVVPNAVMQLHITQTPPLFLSSPTWALWSIILVGLWKYTPFMVILVLARLQTVPKELKEAASIDGASPWQGYRYVTLPWLAPAIMVATILRAIWAINEYDIVYLLAYGGPLDSTTTLPILLRRLAFDELALGDASALATIMTGVLALGGAAYFRLYGRTEERLN